MDSNLIQKVCKSFFLNLGSKTTPIGLDTRKHTECRASEIETKILSSVLSDDIADGLIFSSVPDPHMTSRRAISVPTKLLTMTTTSTSVTAAAATLPPRIQLFISSPEDDTAVSFAHAVSKILTEIFALKDVSVRSIDRLLWFGASAGIQDNEDRPILHVVLGTVSPQESLQLRRLSAWHPLLILDPLSLTASDISFEIAKWCSLASLVVRAKVQDYWNQQRQAQIVQDAQLHTQSPRYQQAISTMIDSNTCITGDKIVFSTSSSSEIDKVVGKVRNIYRPTSTTSSNTTILALVTTDRVSGFDRHLAMVPYKGAVLNLTSAYWFEQTRHIIPNHVIAVPHPYITIAKQCQPFPIEFVVRYV
jgi:hypothetical protein